MQWEHLHPTVFIVDNASKGDDVECIKRACPTIHMIRNSNNLGFAGGNNQGIIAALNVADVPLLLLNNDAIIEENDVEQLLESLTTAPNIGFVGPLLFDANDRRSLLAAGGRTPVLHHHSHIMALQPGARLRPVDYVPGTAVLVHPRVFKKVGLLDEDYFFTMEIADLCERARQQGYRSAIDTDAQAFHALDRSGAFRDTLYTYYIIRNRFLFIRKFYTLGRIPLFCIWASYSWALRLKMLWKKNCYSARATKLGLRDGLVGRFGGQNERVNALLDNHCDE